MPCVLRKSSLTNEPETKILRHQCPLVSAVEYSPDSFPSILDFKRCLAIVNGEKTLPRKSLQQTPFSLFGQPCVSIGHGKTSLQCHVRSDNVVKRKKKFRVLRGTCKTKKNKNKVLTK